MGTPFSHVVVVAELHRIADAYIAAKMQPHYMKPRTVSWDNLDALRGCRNCIIICVNLPIEALNQFRRHNTLIEVTF